MPSKLDGFLLCLPEPETSVLVGSLSPLDPRTSRLLDCAGLSPLVAILVTQVRIVCRTENCRHLQVEAEPWSCTVAAEIVELPPMTRAVSSQRGMKISTSQLFLRTQSGR